MENEDIFEGMLVSMVDNRDNIYTIVAVDRHDDWVTIHAYQITHPALIDAYVRSSSLEPLYKKRLAITR